jgi:hypothetical protein
MDLNADAEETEYTSMLIGPHHNPWQCPNATNKFLENVAELYNLETNI